MSVIFITGLPCSGKSFISYKFISENPEYTYFSTGDYARYLGMNPNEASIASVGISLALNDKITTKVLELAEAKEKYIVDGFPRSEPQLDLIKSKMRDSEIWIVESDITKIYDRYEKRTRGEFIQVFRGRVESGSRFLEYLKSNFECKIINN